ncbi:glycosyltransferase [Massilia yuzhufengensis]|uniref:Zeaxanthin glucosyltransferase n=1 Tax=Massilia yuzhufengensis TaxID=1164594 RepID=A0A1I1KFC5_9BURK|nr:glycosyltransferase [Massilia yuzhufengensis]SFC56170.1 zeaxanthin glucosyltransferase [Massilia yuzhufengensis]
MAHFGVVAPAFFSHFNALEALAGELAARGHRVTFLQRPDAAAFLRDPLAAFHAVGADRYPAGSLAASLRRAANPGGPLGLRGVILDMARSTDMLCHALPRAIDALGIDAIIADQMEAAGGLVAEGLGIPFVSVACALPVNREPGIPLPVMPFAYADDARGHQMVEGSTRVYDWMMGPHRRSIDANARRLGLGGRGALHECLSPLAQVSQTIEAFDFPRRALPPHFHHVGPLRRPNGRGSAPDHAPMPAIAPGRPFVFASLGTLQGQRFGLFKRIATACRALDAQLLVAHCGGLDAGQERALERHGATWVCAFANQGAVLAHADAVVSHAGLNTVMDAISARTPILALPIAFDQPGAAARVVHAGIGLKASPRFAGSATLRGQLARLLGESSFATRLEAMSSSVETAGGAARAASIVESALGLGQVRESVAAGG